MNYKLDPGGHRVFRFYLCVTLFIFLLISCFPLTTGFDSSAVKAATDDVVSDAWEIFDTAATDHDGAVFLKVVAFTTDISGDFVSIAETDTGIFSKSRVWLLRSHGADTGADAALLGTWLVGLALLKGIPSLAQGW